MEVVGVDGDYRNAHFAYPTGVQANVGRNLASFRCSLEDPGARVTP